jgi:hypothetical protein
MERIYSMTAPKLLHSFTYVTRSQVLEGRDPEELMLLKRGSHKLVANSLEVPELGAEVERAIRQAEESIEREAAEIKRRMETPVEQKEQKRK